MHISSRYAKILGETNFRTREIPRRGSKAEYGEKGKKERLNDGNNNSQATHGARKPPGPKKNSYKCSYIQIFFEREFFTKFSFNVYCIKHFLLKGTAYKKKCHCKCLCRKEKNDICHFHAVCRDILHVENHTLSKKYFYAKLGSKKVRNFFQVCKTQICVLSSRDLTQFLVFETIFSF